MREIRLGDQNIINNIDKNLNLKITKRKIYVLELADKRYVW